MKLYNVCDYVTERIDSQFLTTYNYISTENMLPNKEGITYANNIPKGNVIAYNKGDILISNIRPYFKKIWQANINGGCSSDVLCIRAKSTVSSKFLFYLLSQQSFFDYVMSGSKGCKMPRGDKQQIMQWDIELPTLEEQITIANILSSLDDKIELNRRINENLEQQAQALFKSWFVDFEPFKDGKFVDSELGMIPEGWKVISIGEIVNEMNTGGDAIQKTPIVEYNTGIRCIRVGDFTNNRAVNDWGFTNVNDDIYKQYKLNKGDILITRTASIGLVRYIFNDLNAVYNNGIIRLIINENVLPSLFVYCYLNSDLFSNHISKIIGETSVRPNMKINYVSKFKLLLPINTVFNKFTNIVSSIYGTIEKNILEIHKLAQLRDTLLPKLMSGELKLSEIETKLNK